MPKNEEVKIKIPAGIEDGQMIKLSGQGEAIASGVPGDLYVKIHVKPHSLFRREGNNLVMNLDLRLSDALLGGEKEIKTLDGLINFKNSCRNRFGRNFAGAGKRYSERTPGQGRLAD